MELGYLCRLRSIETITLTEANGTAEGLSTNRRKGSRDNLVEWTPRLRAAWDGALALRRASPNANDPKRFGQSSVWSSFPRTANS